MQEITIENSCSKGIRSTFVFAGVKEGQHEQQFVIPRLEKKTVVSKLGCRSCSAIAMLSDVHLAVALLPTPSPPPPLVAIEGTGRHAQQWAYVFYLKQMHTYTLTHVIAWTHSMKICTTVKLDKN